MQLVTAEAGDGLPRACVDDLRPHRMRAVVGISMATQAERGIPALEQLLIFPAVRQVALRADHAVMSELPGLVLGSLGVEVTGGAKHDLIAEQKAFSVGSVGVVAVQARALGVHDMRLGLLHEPCVAAVAIQTQILRGAGDGEAPAGRKVWMALAAIPVGEGGVLVGPHQAGGGRGMRIVAGCAVGFGQGPARMRGLEGRSLIMAVEAQSRNRLVEQTGQSAAMAGVAGQAIVIQDGLVHVFLLHPAGGLRVAGPAKICRRLP